MENEKKYLKETLELVAKLKEENRLNIVNAPKKYSGNKNIAIRDAMLRVYKREEERLRKIDEKPYFARIDFCEDGASEFSKFYIGKKDIVDRDKVKVVDWRSPIASLYYDNHLGDISYDCIDGKTHGKLSLKRQYDIQNGKLNSFHDVEMWTEDALLKKYLDASVDIRLKNIVATIQKSQDEIIRKPISRNCIVQGVAGSGKTTVALHKIAYLVYNYIDKIKESQYMIIGPNKFFLNYISSVLPDLDVAGAAEATYEELAEKYLGGNVKISSRGKAKEAKYKCSLACKEDIDVFYAAYIKEYLDIVNSKVKRLDLMQFTANIDFLETSLESAVKQIKYSVNSYLEVNNEKIIEKIKKIYNRRALKNPENKIEILQERKKEIDYLEKELYKCVVKAFKLPNTIDVYNKFLEEKGLCKVTKKTLTVEDLAACMYIEYLLHGNTYIDYRQVVLDEAQDFGLFNIFVLTKIFKNATFSIFGDSAQSIHSYRSMQNLQEVTEIFGENAEYMELNKSYRNTIEIIEYANKILQRLNLPLAEAVVRHGDNVEEVITKDSVKEVCDNIEKNIEMGYNQIAVICENAKEAEVLSEAFNLKGIQAEKLDKENMTYESGVCLITPEFAKGLEFDSVIIADASKYEEDALNLKRMYVAVTRALHRCTVITEK